MDRTFDSDALVASLTAPFAAPTTTGVDAFDDADHEAVREQAARLFAVGAGSVDWRRVVELGVRIVGERSKDVRIATYIAAGLWHVHGLAGLTAGLTALAALLRLGDDCFPADPDGRAGALEWLDEALERGLADAEPETLDAGALAAAAEATRAVVDAARASLGEHAPPLPQFTQALQRTIRSAPTGDADVDVEEDVEAAAEPESRTSAAAVAPPATDAGADEQADDALARLVAVAAALRSARPDDAVAFRLLRAGLWDGIEAAPAAVAGRCEVPPVPRTELSRLARLETHAGWAELVEACESLMVRHRFCLDLQRLSLRGLAGLGASHTAARCAVVTAVTALVTRMPELLRLRARDGSPLADEATQAVIIECTRAPTTTPEPVAGDEDIAAVERAADDRWRAGEAEAALRVLGDALAGRIDARGRFLLRQAIARTLARSGKVIAGAELHAALFQELEARRLVDWEPALARRCAVELLRNARGWAAPLRERLPVRAAHTLLCGLDPLLAAEFTEGVS